MPLKTLKKTRENTMPTSVHTKHLKADPQILKSLRLSKESSTEDIFAYLRSEGGIPFDSQEDRKLVRQFVKAVRVVEALMPRIEARFALLTTSRGFRKSGKLTAV